MSGACISATWAKGWERAEVQQLDLSTGFQLVVGAPATSSFAIARCVETTCEMTVSPTDVDQKRLVGVRRIEK